MTKYQKILIMIDFLNIDKNYLIYNIKYLETCDTIP